MNNLPLPLKNPNGITVRQLRQWLIALPDIGSLIGEEPTVWIDTNGFSNEIVAIYPSSCGDVLLEVRDEPTPN